MKIALIVCGQMRNIDMCIKTWEDYLFPFYDCDVYVATQDANAVKGRIYVTPIVVNQYIFQPIKYDIEKKLKELFGIKLKAFNIRTGMYDKYISDQGSDFVLKNSLGWSENFKDMTIALELAEKSNITYDIYIKIRPDICLCKPFFKIDKIIENSIYVNDKHDNYIWDAVFAMDHMMATKMKDFYSYYCNETISGITKCFSNWDCTMNAEDKILHYLNLQNANIINMGDVGYPITWLIGDFKNENSIFLRYKNFTLKWQSLLKEYSDKHTPCYFDICNAHVNIETLSITNEIKKYKVAILICGQMRDYKFCMQSINEYICKYYDCDIYVVTQDSISIKSRLGHGYLNQYLVNKVSMNDMTETKEYFKNMFKDNLKEFHVRNTYKSLISNQDTDMKLHNIWGWTEQFKDTNMALNKALNSGITYDLFIKVRPDIIVSRPFNITSSIKQNTFYIAGKINPNCINATCPEVIYGMDRTAASNMLDFYSFYMSYLDKFVEWNISYNTEIKLLEFLILKNINYVNIKTEAYPIQWLVSDERDNSIIKRHNTLHSLWKKHVEEYMKNFRQVIFDVILQ